MKSFFSSALLAAVVLALPGCMSCEKQKKEAEHVAAEVKQEAEHVAHEVEAAAHDVAEKVEHAMGAEHHEAK